MKSLQDFEMFRTLPLAGLQCLTHLVTLKALRSRMQRRTERPTGGITSWLTNTNSMIELTTTTKSNLIKREILDQALGTIDLRTC